MIHLIFGACPNVPTGVHVATEERLITKNVLYAGEGDVPEFENGSKVKTFHSIARL